MPTLDALATRFPEIPPSVMLKIDLLRRGVRMGLAPVGTRHYHHHDEQGQKPVDPRAHIQGSVMLPDGTTVFVAHNPASPYVIEADPDTGRIRLREGERDEFITELMPGPRFGWTAARTAQQTPMAAVFSQSLGGTCGPLAIFLLRYCEFIKNDEECRFCSWVRMGKSHEVRPNVTDMREALGAIWAEQGSIGYLALSGGSLFNRTKEADAFLLYMDAARETGLPLPTTVAAIQALDRPDSARLRGAGEDGLVGQVAHFREPGNGWHERPAARRQISEAQPVRPDHLAPEAARPAGRGVQAAVLQSRARGRRSRSSASK